MIKDILQLLTMDDYYGVSEQVDIAKGKYELVDSIKEGYKQGKRIAHGKNR
jgi:hypothetical protein